MPKIDTVEPVRLDTNALVEELLGLDASAMASMKPLERHDGHALQGLGAFMRHVVELAIQLGKRPQLVLRFETEATAKARRWPNARVANLAMLFVWSLVQRRRLQKGLPFAVLEGARDNVVDPPFKIGRRLHAMSLEQLVDEFETPVAGVFNAPMATTPDASFAISEVQSMLGLDPMALRFYREKPDSAVPTTNPRAHVGAGLDRLLQDALAQYRIMRQRGTTAIRLMSDDDAVSAEIACTRAAHLATLLAAAMHATDGTRDVFFIAPRTRSAVEKAMLRDTAKLVYRDFSEEAMKGFELVCDGFVHFGHGTSFSIAERLLYGIARYEDVDPDLQRMPHCVTLQLTCESLAKMS